MRLKDKVAIVTGAGRGIGKGIALKLAREGAKVVMADAVERNAHEVAEEIIKGGGTAIAAMRRRIQAARGGGDVRHGRRFRPDRYSGQQRGNQSRRRSSQDDRRAWDKVIAVNLTGTFYCLRLAAQQMRERGYGRIVNVSSMSWLGNFGQANYAAAKAGVVGLTKTAARELAKKGVTVNAICPGFIDTEMTRGVPQNVWDIMVGKIWSGKVGTPEDVGNVVAFLVSDEASYVNGEVINVSGGMVL